MSENVSIKIDGKYYPVDQLVGKTVYAKRTTKLYRNPGDTTAKFQVASGGLIGKVWSWATRTDGVWLLFTTNSQQIIKEYPSGVYAVKISDISDDGLVQQGTKTNEQITREEQEKRDAEKNAEKPFTDKLLETGTKVALGIAALWVVGNVTSSAINKR